MKNNGADSKNMIKYKKDMQKGDSGMNRGTVSHVLQILGYEKENIAENYFVQIDGTSAVKYDVVAFSDKYLKEKNMTLSLHQPACI